MSQRQPASDHLSFEHASSTNSERNATIAMIDADKETLVRNLEAADIPTLLMTVAHLTNDGSLLKPQWRPVIDLSGRAMSGMTSDVENEVRKMCLERLLGFRDSKTAVPPRPTVDELRNYGEWMMGSIIEPYIPLIAEELVSANDDPRRPTWHKSRVAPSRDFNVAIIGAGESGLAAAIRLKQAGVPFTIYEKNNEVGGTWLENNYPGCRVDINSFYYSYAFAREAWNDYYSTSEDVLAYLKRVAQEHGIYAHIRFNTAVDCIAWNEDSKEWQLTITHEGDSETVTANMSVSAVGQLNRPKIPDIPGLDSFKGSAFHSARWDHDLDLNGKRIAVIGTGASAVQFIKELAKLDSQVSIFSRTTNWLLPTPDLQEKVSDKTRWLLKNIPNYAMWYRASLVMVQAVGFLDDIAVDLSYPPTETAVSARNDELRKAFTQWMEPQFSDRPDLREALIPTSPVGAKRIIRDNGTWIETLKRDNVTVLNDGIERITETGIVGVDGVAHDFDVIIYGTGFEASEFLMPMTVKGCGGIDLHEKWGDDARAYIGSTIPEFPNLFCMYGPNTNLVVYGSIIMFSEMTANYIVDAVRVLLENGKDAMEVHEPVYETFNNRVDERNRNLTFGFSTVNSWYKNSKGRVTQNFPFHAYDFWQRTRAVVASDYKIT